MKLQTDQMNVWSGAFGAEYTDRNPQTVEDLDRLYRDSYGRTRTDMNATFLGGMARDARILEVGCNVGTQLQCLQAMGFSNLFGIELQEYAVELAKERSRRVNIIQGSAFDIPFKDGYFDLVYTSGVLIHLAPGTWDQALRELHRCTRTFLWGFEYYAGGPTEVPYRGRDGLLWKADFAGEYLRRFPDLEIVRQERFKYLQNDNVDAMFLLRKKA
jgi:pseudaminic acid biosynthesis-associated methylase